MSVCHNCQCNQCFVSLHQDALTCHLSGNVLSQCFVRPKYGVMGGAQLNSHRIVCCQVHDYGRYTGHLFLPPRPCATQGCAPINGASYNAALYDDGAPASEAISPPANAPTLRNNH